MDRDTRSIFLPRSRINLLALITLKWSYPLDYDYDIYMITHQWIIHGFGWYPHDYSLIMFNPHGYWLQIKVQVFFQLVKWFGCAHEVSTLMRCLSCAVRSEWIRNPRWRLRKRRRCSEQWSNVGCNACRVSEQNKSPRNGWKKILRAPCKERGHWKTIDNETGAQDTGSQRASCIHYNLFVGLFGES